LLATDSPGLEDLTQTKVIYPPINNAYFLLNTTDRKDGIVPPTQRTRVVEQLRELLLNLRDGNSRIIHRVYDVETEGGRLGIGGEAGGDVYLEPIPGYEFDPRWDAQASSGDLVSSRSPIGAHGFSPDRRSMRALMVLNGPGLTVGRRFSEAQLIDLAPTLAKLLGLPAPQQASGRILEEVLENRALTPSLEIE
jgi:hypothetical protein